MTANTQLDAADAIADLARAIARGTLIDVSNRTAVSANAQAAAFVAGLPCDGVVPYDDEDICGAIVRLARGELEMPDAAWAVAYRDGDMDVVLIGIAAADCGEFSVTSHRRSPKGIWTTDLAVVTVSGDGIRALVHPYDRDIAPSETVERIRARSVREAGIMLTYLASLAPDLAAAPAPRAFGLAPTA